MKKYILMLAVSVLVLSGCGNKLATNTAEDKAESKLSSINDLLGLGKEQICEWTSDVNGTKASGKLWIKGKNFHQTITSETTGQKATTVDIITDGDWIYSWSSDSKGQGMKMKITDEQKQKNNDVNNESLDWGKQFNYRCAQGTVGNAELTPPSDVIFTDLQALQEQYKNLIPSGINVPNGE